MYLNILKRDLKRKKTMNVILLLFIILATTFVSSSVNNMVSITSALDNYFDIANVPDFTTITLQKGTTENIEDVLDSIEEVDSYEIEELIAMSYEDFMNKHLILNQNVKTNLDMWITYPAFIFDYNFVAGLKYVKRKMYVIRMLNLLNYKNEDVKQKIEKIKDISNEYIKEKCSEGLKNIN